MSAALVEIRGLVVERQGHPVLSVSALTIAKGEVLAVVGPNGAGKSTLLLAIARLLPMSQGEIRFENRPVRELSPVAYRRRLALVLQDPLLLDMTVYNNVVAGLRFRGVAPEERAERAERWLDRLGIAALRDRRATTLSGGEAQRVSLARAFVLEPELLLLDEPFAALDPPTRRRLLRDLTALLAETGTTALLVTHDVADAAQIGHRIAIVIDGVLRRVDRPEQILKGSTDPEIHAFIEQ